MLHFLDATGQLVNFGGPAEDYFGAGVRMNTQGPAWIGRLPEDEKCAMQGSGQALIDAIAQETTFTLDDLKACGMLSIWQQLGGSLEGTSYAGLVGDPPPKT